MVRVSTLLPYHLLLFNTGEGGGSVVDPKTLEREFRVQSPPLCCVLEQYTLLPESTGNTQEVVVPS